MKLRGGELPSNLVSDSIKISMESDTSSFNKLDLFLIEFMFRCAIIRLFLHESRMFFNIDLASAAPLNYS